MSSEPAQSALQALARQCGLPLSAAGTLALECGHGVEGSVQAVEDALVLQLRRRGSDATAEDSATPWVRLLARNAPTSDGPAALIHAIDAQRLEVVAFSRLAQAGRQTPSALHAWLQAGLARLNPGADEQEPTAPDPREYRPDAAQQEDSFAALWRALELEDPGSRVDLSQPRSWTLLPDSGVPVRLSWLPATGQVLLRAIVAVLPTELEDDAPYFQRLLTAHCLGEQTSGSVFAIDEHEAELIVWHIESVALLSGTELSSLVSHVAALALSFAPGEDNDSRRAVLALG